MVEVQVPLSVYFINFIKMQKFNTSNPKKCKKYVDDIWGHIIGDGKSIRLFKRLYRPSLREKFSLKHKITKLGKSIVYRGHVTRMFKGTKKLNKKEKKQIIERLKKKPYLGKYQYKFTRRINSLHRQWSIRIDRITKYFPRKRLNAYIRSVHNAKKSMYYYGFYKESDFRHFMHVQNRLHQHNCNSLGCIFSTRLDIFLQ